MYYTGIDPFTKKPVHIAKHLRDRKLQRALMQFFKPENYFEVRQSARASRPAGFDRQRLRLFDSRAAAQGRAEQRRKMRERVTSRADAGGPHPRRAGKKRAWDQFSGYDGFKPPRREEAETGEQSQSPRKPKNQGVGYRPGRKGSRDRIELRTQHTRRVRLPDEDSNDG